MRDDGPLAYKDHGDVQHSALLRTGGTAHNMTWLVRLVRRTPMQGGGVSSQYPKRSQKDLLIFWLGMVSFFLAGTLGLFPLIGISMSAVHAVLTGVCLLAGSSVAYWISRRFFGP